MESRTSEILTLIMAVSSRCLLLHCILFLFLLFAESGGKNSVIVLHMHRSDEVYSWTWFRFIHNLVLGAVLLLQLYVLLLCGASNNFSNHVLGADVFRTSSTTCHEISRRYLMPLPLAGGFDINPDLVRNQSLVFGQLNVCSLWNEAAVLHDFLCEHSLQILVPNET